MDTFNRTHNATEVFRHFKELGDQLITQAPVSIFVPYRFADRGLLYLDSSISCVGYFAVATETHYGYYSIPSMVTLGQCTINETSIGDEPYYEFMFEKGDVLFESLNLVRQDSLLYAVNECIVAMGNVPAYMNYDDLNLFEYAKYYAGPSVGSTANTMDVFYSIIGRDPDDLARPYRESDMSKPAEFIPFRNIALTASSSMSRVIGSYSDAGIDASLVTKTEKLYKVERLLRT